MGQTVSGVRAPSDTVTTHKSLDGTLRRDIGPRLELESVPAADASAGTVSRALPADLTAVREARAVVQQVLGNWRADEIFEDVVLVASELVANALRHGLHVEHPRVRIPARGRPERPMAEPLMAEPLRTEPEGVRISLVSTGSHVICAVTDPSEAPPVRQVPVDPLAGSGRGLQLVESLSLCWGWTVLDGDADGSSAGAVQGKSVWAIFPLNLPNGSPRPQVVGAA